ncbi:MAG: hypothetical protein GX951_00575 [Mollicutes bacterium]|nr:hypothetical protein [Mollicutes bacterium]
MKKRNGFIFIETIVTAAVLITSLMIIYNSYSKIIVKEKNRLYYDDINYIYKTENIRTVLKNTLDMEKFNNALNDSQTKQYIYLFNYGSDIFRDGSDMLEKIYETYNYTILLYIKISDLKNLKACIAGKNTSDKCENTKGALIHHTDDNFMNYLKTLDVPIIRKYDYSGDVKAILLAEYLVRKNGNKALSEFTTYNECKKNRRDSLSPEDKTKLDKGLISVDMYCENAHYLAWVYYE